MVATTAKKGLRKAELTDNLRDFETGAISGGGQHANMDSLDNAIYDTLVDAKGDLIAGTASDAVARLAVGANGTILTAASGEATGLKWEGAWTAFTPTVAQNGARTITINHARYCVIGKTARIDLKITITDAGTAGNPIIIGAIPAAIAPTRFGTSANIVGVGVFNDISVNIYAGLAIAITAATIQLLACDAAGIGDYMGAQGPNVAVANGDVVSINCAYEIA